jgi:hypothetical protein
MKSAAFIATIDCDGGVVFRESPVTFTPARKSGRQMVTVSPRLNSPNTRMPPGVSLSLRVSLPLNM